MHDKQDSLSLTEAESSALFLIAHLLATTSSSIVLVSATNPSVGMTSTKN